MNPTSNAFQCMAIAIFPSPLTLKPWRILWIMPFVWNPILSSMMCMFSDVVVSLVRTKTLWSSRCDLAHNGFIMPVNKNIRTIGKCLVLCSSSPPLIWVSIRSTCTPLRLVKNNEVSRKRLHCNHTPVEPQWWIQGEAKDYPKDRSDGELWAMFCASVCLRLVTGASLRGKNNYIWTSE